MRAVCASGCQSGGSHRHLRGPPVTAVDDGFSPPSASGAEARVQHILQKEN